MPESVTDRPTKAHEYLFLLAKSPRYFWDADAIREDGVSPEQTAHNERYAHEYEAHTQRAQQGEGIQPGNNGNRGIHMRPGPGGRNRRSVWTVATMPFAGSHFAVFPPKLIEPCVLAGSPPKCCGECGAPWERATGRDCEKCGELIPTQAKECAACGFRNTEWREQREANPATRAGESDTVGPLVARRTDLSSQRRDRGWHSTCAHDDDSGRSLVLDPFAGAGTTGVVALRHDRDFIGIELNPSYARMARNRIYDDGPLFNVEAE